VTVFSKPFIITVPAGAAAFLLLAIFGVNDVAGVEEYTYSQAMFGIFATASTIMRFTFSMFARMVANISSTQTG